MLLVPVVTLVSCHVLLITLLSETCSEVLLCHTIRACSLCVLKETYWLEQHNTFLLLLTPVCPEK